MSRIPSSTLNIKHTLFLEVSSWWWGYTWSVRRHWWSIKSYNYATLCIELDFIFLVLMDLSLKILSYVMLYSCWMIMSPMFVLYMRKEAFTIYFFTSLHFTLITSIVEHCSLKRWYYCLFGMSFYPTQSKLIINVKQPIHFWWPYYNISNLHYLTRVSCSVSEYYYSNSCSWTCVFKKYETKNGIWYSGSFQETFCNDV